MNELQDSKLLIKFRVGRNLIKLTHFAKNTLIFWRLCHTHYNVCLHQQLVIKFGDL